MIGLIYFLLALGLIVVVHEFGHLIVAKRNGVYCHEFSVGMGPRIKHFHTDKTGTEYSLRAIPLGGYVRLAGEEDSKEDLELEPNQLLSNQSAWVKIKVLGAGSFMNLLLTFLIMTIIAFGFGVASSENKVSVIEDFPMYEAGIRTGDRITEVAGRPTENVDEVFDLIGASKGHLDLTVENKDGVTKEYEVYPNKEGKYGVTPYKESFRPLQSIEAGVVGTWGLIKQIFMTIALLLGPDYGVDDLAGPLGIFQMSSGVVKMGLQTALLWIAYLSINIGILNLMPIPALDGGRMVFAFYELIFRRKANKIGEDTVTLIGVFLLLGLFIYVTFNDVLRGLAG